MNKTLIVSHDIPTHDIINYGHVELVSTPHLLSHMLSKSPTFLVRVLKQVQHDGVEMSFHLQSPTDLNTQHDEVEMSDSKIRNDYFLIRS